MNRLIVILLCICGVVVCAFIAYMGYQQNQEAERVQDAPPEISCNELLEKVPGGLQSLTLTQYKPGKHFVSYDDDENDQWEKVLVPMFPEGTKKLGRNYRAVIVCFADTPDKESLFQKINGDGLDAQYWFTAQRLDNTSYNRLAADYSSLDFGRSIVLYSGYPQTSISYGIYMFWGASAGAVLSLLILGWQLICLAIAGFKSETSRNDDEERIITNRAGLPTRDERRAQSSGRS